MDKIDAENLTADDMLDLIQDHELRIWHVPNTILCENSQEGSLIQGKSDGISEAIRSWARKYNEMVEVSNGK